jgi:hypothetical protein
MGTLCPEAYAIIFGAAAVKKPTAITQRGLEELCIKWQGILRLMDWEVKVRFVRHWEMKPDREGAVDWSINGKAASIKILDPRDFSTEAKWPQDVEQVLVHELVHLHLAPFDETDGTKAMLLEQAVDLLACALVDRDRA